MNFFQKILGRGGKMPAKVAVLDVSDDDFQTEVIRRSYKTPVMVDYWASWCGPCRQLGPILERLADEPDSGYMLAKLNTEDNQRTAAQYNIRSIPAIKVFRNGQVVGEFTGGMPEANIRKFMQTIKDAPAPAPRIKLPKRLDDRIKQASQHLKKGRGFEAFVMLKDFPAGNFQDKANILLPLAQFLGDIEDGDWVSGTRELDELFDEAVTAWGQGDPETAINNLLAVLEDSNAPVSQTEAVLEAMFVLLGKGHPLVKANRENLMVD